MNVKELIQRLEKMPQEARVWLLDGVSWEGQGLDDVGCNPVGVEVYLLGEPKRKADAAWSAAIVRQQEEGV